MMKKGAFIINTARGALIDTKALYHALKKKHIAGVGLDVLENECEITEEKQLISKHMLCKTVVENHSLMNMPNVIITPHIAWHSKEALLRIAATTVENIKKRKNRVK